MVDKVHTSNIEKYIINIHEKNIYELKEAKAALPKEFWPTYSSFSNTIGGEIILGVKEDKSVNEIVGVENPEKIINDLWNTLSNKQKVSYNGLSDEDEQKIYSYLYRKGVASKFSEIEEAVGMTEYKIRKCLNSLNEKELVLIMGTGKATRYFVTDKDRILEHMKMILGRLQRQL